MFCFERAVALFRKLRGLRTDAARANESASSQLSAESVASPPEFVFVDLTAGEAFREDALG
jgi:hypothetical protein